MFFSSSVTPAQKFVKNHGHIHDSNEDILKIIRLYNQGNTRTVNNEPISSINYPYLLKYRASNLYVYITAAFSIFASIYADYSLSPITSYIVDSQIKNETPATQILSDEMVSYALSSFYLFGLLGGLLLSGWLGSQLIQRRLLLIISTLTSLIASGAFMASVEYWMLFPAKFLQGLSNTCIWLMCSALIADIWPVSKLGSMIGFVCGLYPLGMSFGLVVGAIFSYVDRKCSFFCALSLSCASLVMQLTVIERSILPTEWLETKSKSQQDETKMAGHDFKDMQQRVMDVMEEGGLWSKSSSMTTINLKDQPVIFEKESESNYKHGASKRIKSFAIYRFFISFHLISLLYQLFILSMIIGALEPALSDKLLLNLNITNNTYRGVIASTFLFPCAVIAFASGWFCDRFGSKIISLTCVIISIPAFIWIGVPNQNIQSIVSALAIGGFTFAGTSVSVLLVATKVLQKIINSGGSAVSDSINHHHLKSAPIIFAVIGSTCGIGYFMGSFLAKFNKSIGFFWLCFIFAMLLATLIPVVAYYSKKSNSKRNGGLGQSTSKKSIINNTRPESFAESIMMSDDDDDTTVGSASAKSICCDEKEGKSSIIVVP